MLHVKVLTLSRVLKTLGILRGNSGKQKAIFEKERHFWEPKGLFWKTQE